MMEGTMTLDEMATLEVGTVLTSTDVIECWDSFWVEPGACLVVVDNTLGQATEASEGSLWMRLAPADRSKVTRGSLAEWCDAVQVYGPPRAAGVDWSEATTPVRVTPDALTLEERVAAVFVQKLFDDVDGDGLAEIARRNASEADPRVCHSHDLCDANVPMLEAFRAMGLAAPIDEEVTAAGDEGPERLWDAAWTLAMRDWVGLTAPVERAAEPAEARVYAEFADRNGIVVRVGGHTLGGGGEARADLALGTATRDFVALPRDAVSWVPRPDLGEAMRAIQAAAIGRSTGAPDEAVDAVLRLVMSEEARVEFLETLGDAPRLRAAAAGANRR